MTKLSKKKTFYAKQFEQVLRNFFNCPSKTASGKPFPYIFMQNKDNTTGVYRTKENGMSDIFCKSILKDTSIIEEKYLTFFPYYNGYGEFTIGIDHWNNFINGVNKSNEETIWGVFCVDKENFILASNKSTFNYHKSYISKEQLQFEVVNVKVDINAGIWFSYQHSDKHGEVWGISQKDTTQKTIPDHNYTNILPEKSFCLPLPRQGKKHLFLTEKGIVEKTFTDIANLYHGNENIEVFIRKLRRNMETNQKQYEKNLRFKSLKNTKVLVIPDDFTEDDFIEWQKEHPLVNKTEDKNYYKDKMHENRMLEKVTE